MLKKVGETIADDFMTNVSNPNKKSYQIDKGAGAIDNVEKAEE